MGVYKVFSSPDLTYCKGSRLPRTNRHGSKTCANIQSFRDIRRVDLSVLLTLLSIE